MILMDLALHGHAKVSHVDPTRPPITCKRRHHMLACNKYLFDGLVPRRYKVPVAKLDPNVEGVQTPVLLPTG
jgi:hypothetical protein